MHALKHRRALVAAVVAGLVGLSLVSALIVHARERDSAQSERRDEAQRAAENLRSGFALTLGGLSSISGLFASSERVTGAEFNTFARTLIEDSPLAGLLLMSRVPDSLRRDFEALPGSGPIEEMTATGTRRAPRRPEYFPIAYRAGRALDVGLDLSADPDLRATLQEARDSGAPRASGSITLPPTGSRGLLVFLPIYRKGAAIDTVEQRRAALTQVAAAAFEARTLGDGVLATAPPGTQLQLLYGEQVVYGPRGELEDAVEEPIGGAGERWRLRVTSPVEASVALPGTILGSGLALSGLVGLLLVGLGRRERDANELSVLRLAERDRAEGAQRTAEERFQRAFEDSGVGMALVGTADGANDRLLEVNDALCRLVGYPRERLMRMDLSRLVHPDDRSAAEADAERAEAGEEHTAQREQRLVDSMGQPVWVLLSTSTLLEKTGEPAQRILQVQDVSERKRFEGQLQHLADHDPLTGLFNRRRFEEELARELTAAGRYKRGGAVLALDLDHFKYINDSLGHSLGDELIARVGGLLQERLRDSDTIARLGGDEFAVILPEAGERRALAVAEDVRRTVRDGAVVAGKHGRAGTTASIGVALFSDDAGEITGEELLAEADIAMYDAKEGGRDRVAVYSTAGRDDRMAARMTWVERIREALAEDRFVLHGQRIESLSDDGRERHELLLRMEGHDGDLIPPASFLPVAERFDLIREIDRWVVRHAIALLARMQASGRSPVLEVNLSAKSVIDPSLPGLIESELEAHGADPAGLVFEMTETAAIVNLERAKRFAAALRDLGCEFALDDFGAGFASFYYLKHFAFDYLKIDGEFIEDLPTNATNRLLVRALVQIARGLGKRTIAEFVEDAETLALLRELGVDYAQGFHVARPAPMDELTPAGHST